MLVWAKKVPEDGERGKTEYQHAVQGIDHDGRIDQAQTQPQRGIPGIDKTARSLRAQMASCALTPSAEGVAHRKAPRRTLVARTAKVVDIYDGWSRKVGPLMRAKYEEARCLSIGML